MGDAALWRSVGPASSRAGIKQADHQAAALVQSGWAVAAQATLMPQRSAPKGLAETHLKALRSVLRIVRLP